MTSTKTRSSIADFCATILELVCHGATDNEIGAKIGYSGESVHGYLQRLRGQCGARNRAHLVYLAIQEGAVTVTPLVEDSP